MSQRRAFIEELAALEDLKYGSMLLRLLSLAGWRVHVSGGTVCVAKDGVGEVVKDGTIADVAPDVFIDAVELQREANGADRDDQSAPLQLVKERGR